MIAANAIYKQVKGIAREIVPPIVMRALRPTRRSGNYFSAAETIAAAGAAGVSVQEYIKRILNDTSAELIAKFQGFGAITPATKTVVEIGPGTGRFIEQTLKQCTPDLYQIYELDDDWSSWLSRTYPIEACATDGRSLKSTKAASVDLIQAHGVFVYLPFLTSYSYFQEIIRVAAPKAFVIFDIISERCMEPQTVERWLKSGHQFPCFLSTNYVIGLFEQNGFRLAESLLVSLNVGMSEYLVFTRTSL